MKQSEIKPCAGCGKGVAHDNSITFYEVKIGYRFLNVAAIQRQTGLEMMLGDAGLASVMGADEDIGISLSDVEALVCLSCAMSKTLAELWELMAEKEPEDAIPNTKDR